MTSKLSFCLQCRVPSYALCIGEGWPNLDLSANSIPFEDIYNCINWLIITYLTYLFFYIHLTLRQKIGLLFCEHYYWFSSWARILNVQDIIIEITKETSISSTCRPISFTTIAGAGQHPCCVFFTPERIVTSTDTCTRQFTRRPIWCTWSTQCRPTHPIPVQCWASVAAHCCFNAGQSYSPLKRNWVIVRVCSWLSYGCTDALSLERPLLWFITR